MIRVTLVDDHALVRAGIRALLKRASDIEVVDEASNGVEALKSVEARPTDVVLMDILMPVLNGIDAGARLATRFPNVKVIILSMNISDEYVVQAMRNGAAGYLQKNISPDELIAAIRAAVKGEIVLGSSLSKHIVNEQSASLCAASTSHPQLTSRQREVLQLVAEGFRTKDIAKKLNVSTKTIEMHRAQLMRVLHIHDVASLVRYAIRIGLVSASAGMLSIANWLM